VYATEKSYILNFDPETDKWPLYVNVTSKMCVDHRKVVASLLSAIGEKGLSKEEAIALRDDYVRRIAD
jgi:hypothetical protein